MISNPFNFIKLSLYVKIDIKYEIRTDQSTKFQFNPSKNRKVGKKLDFDPKTKNEEITVGQWLCYQFYYCFG